MKFENAIIYNGKFYRAGEEVPVEKIEKATDENTTVETDEKVEDSTDESASAEKVENSIHESTTTEKVSKRRTKPKTEVN